MTLSPTLCKHPKLDVQLKVSSESLESEAIVRCKTCGFSVEIKGQNLTEPVLLQEFNKEAYNLRLGRKQFSL